jgi:hypothetical protein
MSISPINSANLSLWAFGNGYISDAAVFLSVGSACPKLMQLMSISHLAAHI